MQGVTHAGRPQAVQYLRMSTEHQRYSLENQRLRIAEYAKQNGYDIVETYMDAGRSGLTLRERRELNRLLRDVTDPARQFSTILVLDVSRWGRFQNPDQSAAYEFICRELGVRVEYVSEAFTNDGSTASSMMKHMKRIMAAEYSRELSARVSFGHARGARRGHRQGGPNVYGLRRLLVDAAGQPKCELRDGEWKSLAGDRVVVVPGPAEEQQIIRRIFELFLNGASLCSLARHLNAAGIPSTRGTPWSSQKVRVVLGNELYAGVYVFNRGSTRLKTPRVENPRSLWIRVPIFEGIVSADTFQRAQEILAVPRTGKGNAYSGEKMLDGVKRLWAEKGRLSAELIDACSYVPHSGTYAKKFGSLEHVYAHIGYRFKPAHGEAERSKRGGKPYTKDELLGQLRRALAEYKYLSDGVLRHCPYTASVATFAKAFGSVDSAFRVAGYMEGKPRPARNLNYDKKDALAALKRLFDEHGYITGKLLIGNVSLPSDAWFRRHFGSLANACMLAGIGDSYHAPAATVASCVRRDYLESPEGGLAPVHGHIGQMPDEQLFQTARRIYNQYGFINRHLIQDDPQMPSVYRLLKRYASLAHFYAAAGLPPVMSFRRSSHLRERDHLSPEQPSITISPIPA
jgi:DNA invertase Pin-like site-specific DNA recombinase